MRTLLFLPTAFFVIALSFVIETLRRRRAGGPRQPGIGPAPATPAAR